jgi:SAM domain (Sterile alpha motif)
LDIAVWLRDLGLERYAQVFRDAEISGPVLPDLTEFDLRDLGVPLGPRKMCSRPFRPWLATSPRRPFARRGQRKPG